MTPKNSAAVELGRRGGKARAANLSAKERQDAARKAVEVRWAKEKELAQEISEGSKELLKVSRAAARARWAKAKKQTK